ncbi:pyruvate carboxyltransferase [Kouleothrix aurantiaca]|uniref:Pyruvate carboxyltransferase n=1 Tax=Kouleothrix aurantiaca TaxID=186479 RepID=A0A0P9D4C7_9CHLR|nr:pyruvate carboxyltransferase [Kouleothrix aurantiaca]
MNAGHSAEQRTSAPPFLAGENPAQERYHEASELFALLDYLKALGFGVFSIRESLQAVGERIDGTLQGFHLSADEARQCIAYMDSLGVGVVELPAYPANRYGQALNHTLLAEARAAGLAIEFAAHARCVEGDIRAAWEAGFRRVHLYIGTSKIKQATARKTIEQIAATAARSIVFARGLGFSSVRISTEDAFRTTLDDYEAFYTHLAGALDAAGVQVEGIGIPDTVGLSTLRELGDRIAVLRRVGLPFQFLECHIHNDIGNADRTYVDTLMLCMRLGITMLPDFSILGIGERNGTIGLSSLLESIYRRLIVLYPRKMPQIRQAMREKLGTLPSGELFVNRYRDMDAFFYRIMARTGFVFDRSPFSANTEFDGSGVHADTTMRAFLLAQSEGMDGQDAVDQGNSAYAGALPPYDMPLRTPVLACFGCGKSNVRYWRERSGLALRPEPELRAHVNDLDDLEDFDASQPLTESAIDELIAQLIRCYSIKQNGISHQDAMELVGMFYAPIDETVPVAASAAWPD